MLQAQQAAAGIGARAAAVPTKVGLDAELDAMRLVRKVGRGGAVAIPPSTGPRAKGLIAKANLDADLDALRLERKGLRSGESAVAAAPTAGLGDDLEALCLE